MKVDVTVSCKYLRTGGKCSRFGDRCFLCWHGFDCIRDHKEYGATAWMSLKAKSETIRPIKEKHETPKN